jgi:hypothetical protein
VTKQQQRLEAAGWQYEWLYRVVKQVNGDEQRVYSVVATKANYEVEVAGGPTEAQKVWEHTYMEAKRLAPEGLED